jgi:hypothetical protein
MKKPSTKSTGTSARRVTAKREVSAKPSDDLQPHYDFDYAKARPNRFATRFAEGALAVVLDPDVARVFDSAEAVNSFLRSAISAMPAAEGRKKKRVS